MRYILIAVLALATCGCQMMFNQPTPARVFRFEGSAFRHCQVVLGWTAEELGRECGAPMRQFRSANNGADRCVAYENYSHSLSQGIKCRLPLNTRNP